MLCVKKLSLLVASVIVALVSCFSFGITSAFAIDAQPVDADYLFNHGYYFYRNTSCPVTTVTGDFTYITTKDPYFPQSSGGSYGRMYVYSTNQTPANSIGKTMVVKYANAGYVKDAARPNYAEACDLEITFIVRRAHNYDATDDLREIMGRAGTTEIGVATDLSRGFRFTGIDYADMQVKFYSAGTNHVIPIGSMWFASASLQACEGFNINNAVEGYVSGDGYYLNPDISRPGWRNNAYAASSNNRWRAVAGSYVYEYGHLNSGGAYGFFGIPPIEEDYEIIDQIPSDKQMPDGRYFRRTLNWRAGSVLANLSNTDVMSGAIFSWNYAALSNYSDSVRADASKLQSRYDDWGGLGGAIWFVPNFTPATAVVPQPPVKSANKVHVTGGDSVTFTIQQRIGRRGSDMAEGFGYESFSFYDDVPYGLDYSGGTFTVLDQNGSNITGYGTFSQSGQRLNFVFSDAYLDNIMNYDGGIITFRFTCSVNANTLQNSNILKYDNTAHTVFNNQADLISNVVTVVPYVMDVNVKKVSGYPDLLNGNSLYSLAGAKFDSRRNGNNTVLHTYQTDASGNTSYHRYVGVATYTITETQRSAGHLIANPASQSFTINDSTAATSLTLTYTEPPIVYATSYISVKKDLNKNSVDTTPKWQGDSGDGSGFKVRIDFYPNLTWSGSPYASAVFKADARGSVAFSNASPVDGTTWRYRWNNQNVIPLGSIKITEVAAPTGYRVNTTPKYAKITDSGGVAIFTLS